MLQGFFSAFLTIPFHANSPWMVSAKSTLCLGMLVPARGTQWILAGLAYLWSTFPALLLVKFQGRFPLTTSFAKDFYLETLAVALSANPLWILLAIHHASWSFLRPEALASWNCARWEAACSAPVLFGTWLALACVPVHIPAFRHRAHVLGAFAGLTMTAFQVLTCCACPGLPQTLLLCGAVQVVDGLLGAALRAWRELACIILSHTYMSCLLYDVIHYSPA